MSLQLNAGSIKMLMVESLKWKSERYGILDAGLDKSEVDIRER